MFDIIIVNWNAGDQLFECIESVLAHGEKYVSQVIVVDNGSTDGSLDAIDDFPIVQIIRTGKNLGFAAACNIGASQCTEPYLLFLNPDTKVEADSFSVPLEFMELPDSASVGICGIQLIDEFGHISRTCARFPTLGRLTVSALGLNKLPGLRGAGVHMSDWGHHYTSRVDHVIGAFFVIRRHVFEACKGFDERFFVYLEDVDLSKRCKTAGWVTWYLTESRAFHAGGGTSRQVKARRLFYSLRSRLLYGFKHFPRWQAWMLVFVTCVLEPLTRTVWCLVSADLKGVGNTWSAYRMLWGGIGRIIRGEGRF